MQRSLSASALYNYDSEPVRSFHRRRREQREARAHEMDAGAGDAQQQLLQQ